MVKELQSLCLDIRVLDENGDEIELRRTTMTMIPSTSTRSNETYVTDQNEVLSNGTDHADSEEEATPEDGVIDDPRKRKTVSECLMTSDAAEDEKKKEEANDE